MHTLSFRELHDKILVVLQDVIVCCFMAANLYAIRGCRWFSPSVVILGKCRVRVAFPNLCGLASKRLQVPRLYGEVALY